MGRYLANRLREILTDGKWVLGTNWKEQISTLYWQSAIQQVEEYNTIADLTFHIHYYIEGLIKVFRGGPLDIIDKFSFDAPPIQSEEDWNDLVKTFINCSEEFIYIIEKMNDEQILSDFVDKQYGSNQRNIDAFIEHAYYHLGQVILIKKSVS